ncbi:CDP-6-deoxy-delta-3,4-glucoseen reductase [Pragia fontium]|uniref:CDP-4-dehydro-6-deoxyglucose reductase n=2 Tax=Pragia fontium TaxID=82985 RepID=A0AAJ4WBL9_9GAMM|nr:CDP-6-deoxy-delta-3,4-glucoseen reductase [Pragia fontium]GKX63868.1 CDP-6-deoxy-L-threo-D-glycero-4-hexulose-3-dehydrase reductase [Pragia fontium]SFD04435.1 CDP-4-dehydro-6-deoxyglucose reductase [Pragia fontium DSM 5563 = ATCC 49100]VEJ56175.1 CDP-6-deoxy-L-threo-D-glycero-4-hexulose-3-dehydrase reductase [Pragia fontium]
MSIKIELQPSGIIFDASEDLSILDSALEKNINIEYSCKDGSCGTCKARLLQGSVNSVNSSTLSADEVADGYILTCCAKPKSDVVIQAEYYPQLSNIVKKSFPCKVHSLQFRCDEIAIVHLRIPPTIKFDYLPGQYIDLSLNGVRRSYSIANMKGETIELHIRKVEDGIFSGFIFNELKENALLRAEGPLGTFFIRDDDRPIIFLAGGTGFAPVKAMVEELLSKNDSRCIYIYWGMASQQYFYSDVAEDWSKQYSHIEYIPVVSDIDDEWNGRTGFVHQAVLADFANLSAFNVYACGSPIMIEAARKDFVKSGLPEKQFFSDAFVQSN